MKLIFGVWVLSLMPWQLVGHHLKPVMLKLLTQRLKIATIHILMMLMSQNGQNLLSRKCYSVIQDIEQLLKSYWMMSFSQWLLSQRIYQFQPWPAHQMELFWNNINYQLWWRKIQVICKQPLKMILKAWELNVDCLE